MIERPVSEKWLGERAETHRCYTNAYVGIERRAEAISQLPKRVNQQEDEPNGKRWAREDVQAIKWVRDWEVEIAVGAIERSKELSRGYASEIAQHDLVIQAVRQEARESADCGPAENSDRSGRFVGKILSVGDTVVEQRVGRSGETVLHATSALSRPVQVNEIADIAYLDGKGHVAAPEQSLSHGVER